MIVNLDLLLEQFDHSQCDEEETMKFEVLDSSENLDCGIVDYNAM
jgi:hypothetical protein